MPRGHAPRQFTPQTVRLSPLTERVRSPGLSFLGPSPDHDRSVALLPGGHLRPERVTAVSGDAALILLRSSVRRPARVTTPLRQNSLSPSIPVSIEEGCQRQPFPPDLSTAWCLFSSDHSSNQKREVSDHAGEVAEPEAAVGISAPERATRLSTRPRLPSSGRLKQLPDGPGDGETP